MAATLEEIRIKNRQLAESNLNKQSTINEVNSMRGSWGEHFDATDPSRIASYSTFLFQPVYLRLLHRPSRIGLMPLVD